ALLLLAEVTVFFWLVHERAEAAEGPTALRGHAEPVLALTFSPDGKALASASSDQTVRLWDVAAGEERGTLTGHGGQGGWVAFSPGGGAVVSVGSDKTARLWDTRGQPRGVIKLGPREVEAPVDEDDGPPRWLAERPRAVALSPDSRLLAVEEEEPAAR